MQTQLAHVKLSEISVSDTNKLFRQDTDLQQDSLQELIDSVMQKGVIQPVLLRYQKKNGSNIYELVCGERRYRASLAVQALNKEKDTIPAYVRELSDEEAFDLQLTENLQRKDVHPLKEARAYKFLIDKDKTKNSTAELALRFGKSETYILQRLKLNDLVPEVMKDYEEGMMTLGHALLIARCSAEDQKEIKKQCTQHTWVGNKKSSHYYEHVSELEDFIERNVMCALSSAPFKKDDATLLPKAGACTTCTKRSGANQLFADVKNKDRCFDKACFQMKNDIFLAAKIKELIVEKPDLLYFKSRHDKISPVIEKILTSEKIKVLEEYKDFDTHSWSKGKKLTGIWVNGDKAGHTATVNSTKQTESTKASSNGKEVNQNSLELIAGIKERTVRAAELDREKVYAKILESFDIEKHEAFKKNSKVEICALDELLITFLIWDQAGRHTLEDEFRKMFKIPEYEYGGGNADKLMKAFRNLSKQDKVIMLRMTMREKYAGQATAIHGIEGRLIYEMAKTYGGVPVEEFEAEQKEQQLKREARAKERIKVLQEAAKPKKGKGDTKGTKTAKKKVKVAA